MVVIHEEIDSPGDRTGDGSEVPKRSLLVVDHGLDVADDAVF